MKNSVFAYLPNLLFLIIGQFLIKYALFRPFQAPITLNWFGLSLLSLSTVCLASAGWIIKEIDNLKIDRFRRPQRQRRRVKFPIRKANKLFFICNIVGVSIGFYLANIIGHPSFSILFILASGLLYAEGTALKKYALIGPVILSCLTGLAFLSVGIFDLFPAINDHNRASGATFFSILTDYSLLIFLLNLARELIVSQKNINIDHRLGRQTLPLLLGKKRTNTIIFILLLLPVVGVVYYALTYLYSHLISTVYAVVLILAPLFYTLIKLINAKEGKDYKFLNGLVKLVLFFSILSVGLYQFILK